MTDPTPGGNTAPGFYPDSNGSKKSHTVRNVLLGVIAGFVLLMGGCLALVGGAANEVGKSLEDAEKKDQEPGGPDNPLTIVEGKKFSVSGFDYTAGWKIDDDGLGSVDISGLKVTNNREDKDSALVEIKFMQGNEVLALADCTTDPVAPSQTTTLSCFSADDLPAEYDRITINDTF